MNRYDPDTAPEPAAWQVLSELERIRLVRQHHQRAEIHLPKPEVHAVIHVTVENQIALGVPAVVEAIARLRAEGLDRHEALHAVGSVLIMHVQRLLQEPPTARDPNEAYERELQSLTADGWRAAG